MGELVRVVVWPPEREGLVVLGPKKTEILERDPEVVSLPADRDRLVEIGMVGAGGAYVRRSFGPEGVVPPELRPSRTSSLLVWATPGRHALHYAIGFRILRGTGPVNPATSSLRLASGAEPGVATISGAMTLDVGVFYLDEIKRPTAIVCDRATLDAGSAGPATVCLYGRSRGVAVTWIALSLTDPD